MSPETARRVIQWFANNQNNNNNEHYSLIGEYWRKLIAAVATPSADVPCGINVHVVSSSSSHCYVLFQAISDLSTAEYFYTRSTYTQCDCAYRCNEGESTCALQDCSTMQKIIMRCARYGRSSFCILHTTHSYLDDISLSTHSTFLRVVFLNT
jgi:hypothetical protein